VDVVEGRQARLAGADLTVINYELAGWHLPDLLALKPRCLIVPMPHRHDPSVGVLTGVYNGFFKFFVLE